MSWRSWKVALVTLFVVAACGDDGAEPPLAGESPTVAADSTIPTSTTLITLPPVATSPETDEPAGSASAATTPTPVITWPKSEGVEEALIQGQLTEATGCLYIDRGEGGRGVAVFTYGSTWDAQSSSVVNPDGTSVAVGEPLTASGGSHKVDQLDGWFPPASVRLVRDCADAGGTEYALVLGYLQGGG